MTEQPQRTGPRVIDRRGERKAEPPSFPEVVPVLPLRDAVLFPNTALPALVGRSSSIKLIEQVLAGDRMLATATLRDPTKEDDATPADLPEIGTIGRVAEFLRLPQGGMQVAIQGIARVRFKEWPAEKPFLQARVELLQSDPPTQEAQARMRTVLRLFGEVAEASPYIPAPFVVAAMNISEPGDLADFLAANINMSPAVKQELLEELDVDKRLERIEEHLRTESELLKISTQAQESMSEDLRKMQREQLLRRQLDVIRRELGETEGDELAELRQRVAEANMPDETHKAAERELERLERIPPQSPEWAVSRNYLDWLIEIPWSKETDDNVDLVHAR